MKLTAAAAEQRVVPTGVHRWITLGNYSDISLAEARIEARQARMQVDKQQDPIELRRAVQAEQRQGISFEQLCADRYRSEIVGRGVKHPDVPRRYLDKYPLPKLGRLTAAEVTPAHFTRLLDDVKHRAPTTANDLLRFARRIFSFGVRRLALSQWRRLIVEAELGKSAVMPTRRGRG